MAEQTLEQKIDFLTELVEELHTKVDVLQENDERIEEAIANVSLPGANYSIDHVED